MNRKRFETLMGVLLVLIWVGAGLSVFFAYSVLQGLEETHRKRIVEGVEQMESAYAAFAPVVEVLLSATHLVAFFLAILSGVLLVLLTIAVVRSLRASRVKFLGFEFEITEELDALIQELRAAKETIEVEHENARELSELNRYLGSFVREPTLEQAFEILDYAAATVGHVVRSRRALSVSIWLVNLEDERLRIVSGHRVSIDSKRYFHGELSDQQLFAAIVAQRKETMMKDSGFNEDDPQWKRNPHSNRKTASIVGQPIEIGKPNDAWSAVLCISTDKEEEKFSLAKDAGILEYFSEFLSTVLTSCIFYDVKGSSEEDSSTHNVPMIDRIWSRYE